MCLGVMLTIHNTPHKTVIVALDMYTVVYADCTFCKWEYLSKISLWGNKPNFHILLLFLQKPQNQYAYKVLSRVTVTEQQTDKETYTDSSMHTNRPNDRMTE